MQSTLRTASPSLQRRLRTYEANGHAFRMCIVPAGSFLLDGKQKITFTADYELGQYPVTQALWEAVMGENPARVKGSDRPVERVSWDKIMEPETGFLAKLNALPTIAKTNEAEGKVFGLPSEAQWVYAAHGGSYGELMNYTYAGGNHLPEVGWYDENSQGSTQPSGRKRPNALGLLDLSGNVWEWCADVWSEDLAGIPADGSAREQADEASRRVVRGGSWINLDNYCRVSIRDSWDFNIRSFNIGFRLARYPLTLYPR